ncbi:hypothetical protein COOONC_20663 [Cooperia oncophora]
MACRRIAHDKSLVIPTHGITVSNSLNDDSKSGRNAAMRKHCRVRAWQLVAKSMSTTCLSIQRFCRENTLLVMTIVSVVLGVTLGFGLRPLNLSAETLQLINFPGEIFMQVLKMMILPLIFSSLISGEKVFPSFLFPFFPPYSVLIFRPYLFLIIIF